MEKKMENLTKLSPTRFAAQTAKMARAVEKWLDAVDLDGIKMANQVAPLKLPEGATPEQKEKAFAEHKRVVGKAVRNYLIQLLIAMFGDHPDETMDLMALACCVDPKDKDKHTMPEYFSALTEMLEDEAVVGFFTSLVQSGLIRTSK